LKAEEIRAQRKARNMANFDPKTKGKRGTKANSPAAVWAAVLQPAEDFLASLFGGGGAGAKSKGKSAQKSNSKDRSKDGKGQGRDRRKELKVCILRGH
jgi:hypothetical protein